QEVLGMTATTSGQFAGFRQASEREFAHRLEHSVPVPVDVHDARRHERLKAVDVSPSDLFGRFEAEPTGEDAEPGKHRLLLTVKQLVAPLNRGAKRPLAFREIAPL